MIQLSENTTLGATSQVVGEQEKMMLKKLQEELFPALKKEILKEVGTTFEDRDIINTLNPTEGRLFGANHRCSSRSRRRSQW